MALTIEQSTLFGMGICCAFLWLLGNQDKKEQKVPMFIVLAYFSFALILVVEYAISSMVLGVVLMAISFALLIFRKIKPADMLVFNATAMFTPLLAAPTVICYLLSNLNRTGKPYPALWRYFQFYALSSAIFLIYMVV